MQRLENKICLVTGGAGCIGMAIARRLRDEGAIVLIVDRDRNKLSRQVPEETENWLPVVADVTREDEVEQVVQMAAERFGRMDVLVNNAAGWVKDGPVTDITEADWDIVQAATLKSVFLCSKHVIPRMRERHSGSIINIASVNALFGVALAAYTAAKGGVLSLTRVMAVMHGPEGVRINAISPGTIATDSWGPTLAKNPNALEEWKARYPLRRVGTPEEVAGLVAYLASADAANTTGANFVMDGGISAGIVLPGYGPVSRSYEETDV